MQQENGNGEVSSAAGLKRKGTPLTEEERRIRRKEINRESARRIRKRKNNEMESLKQQVRRTAAGMTAYSLGIDNVGWSTHLSSRQPSWAGHCI